MILSPSFALTLDEVKRKIVGGAISGDATLVLDGPDIFLENVEIMDGSALIIRACKGAKITAKNLIIRNTGFKQVDLTSEEMVSDDTPEYLKLRGYRIEKHGAAIHEFAEPGIYTL